jgi:site-specific recombinase XerD
MSNSVRTLAELEREFLAWLRQEVSSGRCADQTYRYYQHQLDPWIEAVGGDRLLSEIVAFDLERQKTSWHRVQAVQRLFNWAVDTELIARTPFKKVKPPARGERSRVLSRKDLLKLLRAARPALRRFLIAMVHSLARPQEVRVLRWSQLDPAMTAFTLTDFKGKRRRRDGVKTRTICIDRRLRRLLVRLRDRRVDESQDFVFLNQSGRPWTNNAVRLCMARLRERCQLGGSGEVIVAYTLRHTAATTATANGVLDRVLADLMGHSSTRTTARYQHLQPEHLAGAIDQATKKRSA